MTKISQLSQDTTPQSADQVAIVDSVTGITKRMTFSDLSKIMQSLLMPSGIIQETAVATAPSGWLICDGSAISRSTYANLYTAIGTSYGTGDGSTTFNIPDMRGRTAVGVDSAGLRVSSYNLLGQASGEDTHILSTGEMPTHNHSDTGHAHNINAYTSGNEAAGYQLYTGGNGFVDRALVDISGGQITSYNAANIQNTGGGGAHNNMQPYLVMLYIIKT